MAGTTIKITVDDKSVQSAFARLVAAGGPVIGAMKNIGEALVASTQARFPEEKDPDGNPWEPLNVLYAKGKKGPGILRESLQLQMSIVWQLDGDTLLVGSNKIYAAVQQLGAVIVPVNAGALHFWLGDEEVFAQKVVIPARPYLGLSDDDRIEIVAIIEDHIRMAIP